MLASGGRRTSRPRRCGRWPPRRPIPARLARATSRASGDDVGRPDGRRRRPAARRRAPGRWRPSRCRDRRSSTGGGSRPGQLDGDAGDDLGLRPRDQHPAVDGEVEVAEPPAAEDVRPAAHRRGGGRSWRRGGRPCPTGRRLVEPTSLEAVGAARPPRTASGPPGGRPSRARRLRPAARRHVTVPSLARSPAAGELAGPLVGGQRVDDVVEVAGEHVGQPVDREADAVVGDPVLLEVVGPDLLAAAAAADLGPPFDRRARRRARARCARAAGPAAPASPARFCSWLRSSCIATTIPVGRWVMRTAESVVFTLWPPGPLERKTSIWRSLVVDLRPRPPRPRPAPAPSPTTCGCDPGSRSPGPAGPGAARPRT